MSHNRVYQWYNPPVALVAGNLYALPIAMPIPGASVPGGDATVQFYINNFAVKGIFLLTDSVTGVGLRAMDTGDPLWHADGSGAGIGTRSIILPTASFTCSFYCTVAGNASLNIIASIRPER